jgi:hypothetical protein
MPTFEIPDGPTTVDLKRAADGSATGAVVFNVTNKSGDSCNGRLSAVPAGNAKAEWFAVEGDRERTFAAGETQTATVRITAPKDAAAGDYPFRLRAIAVNDPDNDHAEGPVATATVPPPVAPDPAPHIPWWVWLVVGLVLLAVVGGGLFLLLHKSGGSAETVETSCVSTLAGDWKGNDGGNYKITVSGNDVAWNGQSPDGGRSWAHDFHGTRSGEIIQGNWADYRGPMGRGTLTLRVANDTRIIRIANTGSGFGGTIWTRPAPCPTP